MKCKAQMTIQGNLKEIRNVMSLGAGTNAPGSKSKGSYLLEIALDLIA
jgi:hypothetical protein